MSMKSQSQCAAIHPRPGIAESPQKRLKSEEDWEREFNQPHHQRLRYFEDVKDGPHSRRQGRGAGAGRGRGLGLASAGGSQRVPITGVFRTELIGFSKLALDQYNTKTLNQGEEFFVFHHLVKANKVLCAGWLFYITFQAKAKGDGAITTFLAKVWRRIGEPPLVLSCFLKPQCGEQVV